MSGAVLLPAADEKRLATAQARCALWGGALIAAQDDAGRTMFVISRWALTRSFGSLYEVETFLEEVGAA